MDRRRFLKSSLVLGSLFLLPTSAFARPHRRIEDRGMRREEMTPLQRVNNARLEMHITDNLRRIHGRPRWHRSRRERERVRREVYEYMRHLARRGAIENVRIVYSENFLFVNIFYDLVVFPYRRGRGRRRVYRKHIIYKVR